ncbi:hypothetical protein ACJMK2_042451 [Sinanodonta woodiana]|uniref:FAS1 domain-containing protein n=1 Tax=Sinanodonta woodiana TaxID=1069815 RepID=A0ABD3WAP3_SINWO
MNLLSFIGKLFNPRRFGLGFRFDENPFFDISFDWMDSNKPWHEGPNVCFSRTEDKEDPKPESESPIKTHHMFQTQICDGSDTAYKCTSSVVTRKGKTTVTEIYECCPGFSRKPMDHGCPIAKKLQDFISTARELNLNELIRAIEAVDLMPVLTQTNNSFTIFGPTDEAFQKIKSLPLSENEVPLQDVGSMVIVSEQATNTLLQDTRNLVLGHLALGTLTSTRLKNNQLIETASPFKSKIRVNLYDSPQHIMTADCKRIMTVDSVALNGVIHVVEEILQPVTDSLMDKISRNPDLSYLKTAIGRTGLGQMLREDGDFTVFAPTDSAFRKMDPNRLNKLLSEPTCLSKIVKNHVLPSVVCSAVIQGQTQAKNALGNYINLTRDDDNKLYVSGAQVISKDNMATNGVLYIIDDVLLVDDAINALIVAEKSGFTKFLDLIDTADFKKTVENLENVTIFVPTNEGVEALDEATLSDLANNLDKLQAVLKYHIVPSEATCQGFYDNVQLDTLQEGKKIRINEYSSFPFENKWIPTAQCAKIVKTNIKSCNAIIHVVDKVLIPPSGNVVDVLAKDSRFSTLVDLLKKADLADTLQEIGPFTVFAPTNSVFNALGSDAVLELQGNKDLLVKLLKNHVVQGTICCSGIFRGHWMTGQKIRTLSGEMYHLSREQSDKPTIGHAKVTECDKTGTNGVVHVIDRVLMNDEDDDAFWDWWI